MGRQGQVQENPSGSILTRRPQKVVPGGQTATPYTPPVGSSPPRTSQSRPFGVSQPPSIGKADAVEEEMVVDEEEEEEEVAEHVEDLYDTQKRFEEESPLCSSVASYIYPKRAQNKDNHFKFIINVPEKSFVQAVRIERCRAPGDQCSLQGGISFADLGIQTVCRQKYIHRRMLALNEQGEEEVDLFKFPSCCVCHQIELTPFRSGSAPFHSSRRNGRSEDDFDGNFGQSTDITELNEFARTD
ncbi:uncharacterized protein LOC131877925 [Tigriopus californicus]|nr:uncharacterized protein LOC131877925 [Tigriopus californicus]